MTSGASSPGAARNLSAGPAEGGASFALRPSAAVWVTTACLVLIATAALYSSLAARLGLLGAAPAALAVFAGLMLAARRCRQREAGMVKIGPDSLVVRDRLGRLRAHGAVAGCARWGGWLLVIELRGATGRRKTVLIPADALPAASFRELAALGRTHARVSL